MKKFIFFILILLLSSSPCAAGYLIQNATIIEVSNTASNQPVFYIRTSGGTGICNSGQMITFQQSTASDVDIFKRAFGMAVAAYTADMKVTVYDYHETVNDCGHAESLKLVK